MSFAILSACGSGFSSPKASRRFGPCKKLAAICSLSAGRDPEALVQFLRHARIGEMQAIFGNDVEGRQLALRLRDVCAATDTDDLKVAAKIRLVDGGLGSDLGDLFARVKFDPKKFRDEIEQLAFAPRPLLDAWR
jgi:hypothetical protein